MLCEQNKAEADRKLEGTAAIGKHRQTTEGQDGVSGELEVMFQDLWPHNSFYSVFSIVPLNTFKQSRK